LLQKSHTISPRPTEQSTLTAADADDWLAQPASTDPDYRPTSATNPDQQPNEVSK